MKPNIETFHVDTWQLLVSNIPTMLNPEDLSLFERFVKNCNLPEYGLNHDSSIFDGYSINHPMAHDVNVELSPLQFEFKLSQDLKNYLYLYTWMQNLRYGQNIDGFARKYVTNEISIVMLDNIKRTTGKFIFTNCFPISLSALPLNFGTGDELSFNVNFVYEQNTFEQIGPDEQTE